MVFDTVKLVFIALNFRVPVLCTESPMRSIPSEFTIGGVYMPPMLVAAVLGIIAAHVTTRLLNRFRLSRYLFYPALVFLSLAVIFTALLGTVLIPF